jgi:outer membrane protein OmpA-like peptidoglycan-associated protein
MADQYKIVGPTSRRHRNRVEIRVRRRAKSDIKPAEPQPEPQEPDITGMWEWAGPPDVNGDHGMFLQVNRAGKRIEGWHLDHASKTETAFGGDVVEDGDIVLQKSPGYTEIVGRLRIDGEQLRVTWGQHFEHALTRMHHAAALSDEAMLAFPENQRQAILHAQRRPLLSVQRSRIVEGTSGPAIRGWIVKYLNESAGATSAEQRIRAQIVVAIDRYVGNLFQGIHHEDLPLARRLAMGVLSREQYTDRDERTQSVLAWLIDMAPITKVRRERPTDDPIPSLHHYLGIGVDSTKHYYMFKVAMSATAASTDAVDVITGQVMKAYRLKSVGLGGGIFRGTLIVTELTKQDKVGPKVWSQSYPIWLAQLGVGMGISLGSEDESENHQIVVTPFNWRADDFPGIFHLVDLTAGGGSYSIGATGLFLRGSERFPEMAADLSGLTKNYGLNAELSMAIGYVLPAGQTKPQSYRVPDETKYEASVRVEEAIHFPFSWEVLTEEARQKIRILAAKELALFRSGQPKMYFVGHADRVDEPEWNIALSHCRAFNAGQALRDALGKNYKYNPDKEPEHFGLGELGAAEAKDKDNIQNPNWRRVDIFINGRLVVQLSGE